MRRRQLLRWLAGLGAPWPAAATEQPLEALALPRPLAAFEAGVPGSVDLAPLFGGFKPGVTQLRLRANPTPRGAKPLPFVALESQAPEYRLSGSRLQFDGGAAAARVAGA